MHTKQLLLETILLSLLPPIDNVIIKNLYLLQFQVAQTESFSMCSSHVFLKKKLKKKITERRKVYTRVKSGCSFIQLLSKVDTCQKRMLFYLVEIKFKNRPNSSSPQCFPLLPKLGFCIRVSDFFYWHCLPFSICRFVLLLCVFFCSHCIWSFVSSFLLLLVLFC